MSLENLWHFLTWRHWKSYHPFIPMFHLHTFHLYVISLHLMKMETFQTLKKIYSTRMRNSLKKLQICLGPFFMPRNTFHLRQFQVYLPCFQYGGIIPSLLQPSNIFLAYCIGSSNRLFKSRAADGCWFWPTTLRYCKTIAMVSAWPVWIPKVNYAWSIAHRNSNA